MKIDTTCTKTIVNDSPLGRWTHTEYRPQNLAGVVDVMWHFEGLTAFPRERSFAKTHSEIILQLGPRFHEVRANGERGERFPEACVGGATTAPSVIEAPAEICCVMGIQLSPLTAARLFRVPPVHILDHTIDLTDAISNDAIDLADRCHSKRTVEERFAVVHQWIYDRLVRGPELHRGIAWAVRELKQSNGTAAIAHLQNELGISRARFGTLFLDHVGLAPKQFARILRFQNALAHLRNGHSLSGSALSSGYYDQAHMHRDFNEFAMLTPSAFLSATRFPNSASLPEGVPK